MNMEYLNHSSIKSSRLIYGCMRICGNKSSTDLAHGTKAIRSAIDAGYTHFDHADIYSDGDSELLFGKVLRESPNLRDNLFITSKAGIKSPDISNHNVPKHYDFSQQYITQSVDNSLKRLGIDQLDMFMLHRPDYLMDINEVADTFERLKANGKVKNFGVSNFSVSQISVLQSVLSMPLIANQIEINIHNITALTDGMLDHCQQHNISPIAWCPLGGAVYPAWGNTFSNEQTHRIKIELEKQASRYQVQYWIIVLAWLLKHPAQICPIIGSTTPERIAMAKKSLTLDYSREDWYRLLEARNGYPVA